MLIFWHFSKIIRSKRPFSVVTYNKFLWKNKQWDGPGIADYLAPGHRLSVPKPRTILPLSEKVTFVIAHFHHPWAGNHIHKITFPFSYFFHYSLNFKKPQGTNTIKSFIKIFSWSDSNIIQSPPLGPEHPPLVGMIADWQAGTAPSYSFLSIFN